MMISERHDQDSEDLIVRDVDVCGRERPSVAILRSALTPPVSCSLASLIPIPDLYPMSHR